MVDGDLMDKKELGKKVKLARNLYMKKTGIKMTQQLLAASAGISRSYLGDIESGRTYPTFLVLNNILKACDLPLSFFEDSEEDLRIILESKASHALYPQQGTPPEAVDMSGAQVDGNTASLSGSFAAAGSEAFEAIPILGTIRAGEPMLAQQNIIGYEYMPASSARGGAFFGLRVVGDSMNRSRIFDGDTVLVRRQESVENGEIAVVVVDDENATVKRFYQNHHTVTLVPDSTSSEYSPRHIDLSATNIKVLGKVVKVIVTI